MRRLYCTLLLCLAVVNLHGQKLIKKSLLNSNTSFFQIDTSNCYSLELETSEGAELVVEAVMDGEYSKDLVINIREEGNSMQIGAGFEPNFVNPNDKLSAHKVISIVLKVKLPEHMNTKVLGTNCNVKISGSYRNLEVILDDGRCTLTAIEEEVKVKTQSGDIYVYNTGGEFMAETKYGHVFKEDIPKGDSKFALYSISGNINLLRIK